MTLERSNASNKSYTGTSTAVKILVSVPTREYLALYAVSGDAEIVFGSEDFDSNAITIPVGYMWEPKKILTNEIWFRGDSSVLTVLT